MTAPIRVRVVATPGAADTWRACIVDHHDDNVTRHFGKVKHGRPSEAIAEGRAYAKAKGWIIGAPRNKAAPAAAVVLAQDQLVAAPAPEPGLLQPCPFCSYAVHESAVRVSADGLDFATGDYDGFIAWVECMLCAASGPVEDADTEEAARSGAIKGWNSRGSLL